MNEKAAGKLYDRLKITEDADRILGKSDFAWRFFLSPGRVNLIGEHLDYNGGHVLPCAIDMGNIIALRRREDTQVFAFSKNFESQGIYQTDVENPGEIKDSLWVNFLLGSLKVLDKKPEKGFDIYLKGNLPNGSGLSSSASITCGMLFALNEEFDLGISRKDIALKAQMVENIHIGVKTGIMDQYAILFGEKDHATYIDTLNLDHEIYSLMLSDYTLVISNTNKKRALQNSEYNDRREACEKAQALLGRPIAGVDPDTVRALPLPAEVLEKAVYVAEEEERTRKAVKALSENNIPEFATLMNESHEGLKNKFRVTGTELDTLTELMRKNGAIGSRMTGAGFGGCTISIIPSEGVNQALEKTSAEYEEKIGYSCDHYIVVPSDGTREVF